MPLAPEELLQQAVQAGTLDEQKGRAALAVYIKLQEMGAEFGFGDFLVERGLLTRMAVDAFNADTGESFSAVDTLGDFELIELLGEGENGAVFRAVQKTLGREVAVKVLNTEIAQEVAAVERFLREARAVARLNHPNVVAGYSVGSESGLHYFAMELLQGGSARDAMEREGGSLTERRGLEIVREAALGLHAAHAAGILHRDVKPDNILLNTEGTAKLTDLGIAQLAHATAEGGIFWGSPPYVAPEIVAGTAQNDARSDIYSLGATLYELLSGAPPFQAETPEEILRMHLDEPLPDIRQFRPDLSPKTVTLLKLMLAKVPGERAMSASVVANAIDKILVELKDRTEAPAPKPVAVPALARPVRLKPKSPVTARPGRITRRPSIKPPVYPKKSVRPSAIQQRPGAAQRPNSIRRRRP